MLGEGGGGRGTRLSVLIEILDVQVKRKTRVCFFN